jgi:anti-sigma-K factor RskA
MTHDEFESLALLDAAGALTPEEQQALAGHLATCSDCKSLHAEMQETAAAFALQLDPVAPPDEMRARVLAAVTPETMPAVATLRPRNNTPVWWFATAATLLLALWGWRELAVRSLRETLQNQSVEMRQLQEENQLLEEHNSKLTSQISSLATPGTRTIALASTTGALSASARAFVDPSKRRAVIFFYDLPPNTGDKSYQLWIIRADQPKPQSAGTFDVTPGGRSSVTLENLPIGTEIKGLAVTLEPRGGVQQPTSDILLSGKT